jgi:hypothetical protein
VQRSVHAAWLVTVYPDCIEVHVTARKGCIIIEVNVRAGRCAGEVKCSFEKVVITRLSVRKDNENTSLIKRVPNYGFHINRRERKSSSE